MQHSVLHQLPGYYTVAMVEQLGVRVLVLELELALDGLG
jgi:hypothetical protein